MGFWRYPFPRRDSVVSHNLSSCIYEYCDDNEEVAAVDVVVDEDEEDDAEADVVEAAEWSEQLGCELNDVETVIDGMPIATEEVVVDDAAESEANVPIVDVEVEEDEDEDEKIDEE